MNLQSMRKGYPMIYPKNVPNIERFLRILLGIILVGIVVLGPSVSVTLSPLMIGALLFSAVFVVVTGFVGWCPACAMLGRKLKNNKTNA
jgi:hypothetical protein